MVDCVIDYVSEEQETGDYGELKDVKRALQLGYDIGLSREGI